jgi:hypothetical protein
MPFKPGQSGNPAGGLAKKPFLDNLKRAIAQNNGEKVREAAEKLLDLAALGEPWAVKELADRLDGKAAQSVQLSGDEENPLTFREVIRKIIE